MRFCFLVLRVARRQSSSGHKLVFDFRAACFGIVFVLWCVFVCGMLRSLVWYALFFDAGRTPEAFICGSETEVLLLPRSPRAAGAALLQTFLQGLASVLRWWTK